MTSHCLSHDGKLSWGTTQSKTYPQIVCTSKTWHCTVLPSVCSRSHSQTTSVLTSVFTMSSSKTTLMIYSSAIELLCKGVQSPCNDGFGCYPTAYYCDGVNHCRNGYDETECTSVTIKMLTIEAPPSPLLLFSSPLLLPSPPLLQSPSLSLISLSLLSPR